MMEIGLIIVLAVMLFPPKELPKLVRSIARVYGQVRKTAEDFRSAILDDEDLREPIEQIKGAYNDARWEVRDAERKARQELAKAQMELRLATARRIQSEREVERKAKNEEAGEGEAGDGEAGDASQPGASNDTDRGRASPAGPVRIAAPDADDDADTSSGPVAASDPRAVAARRPPAYTPPSAEPEPEAGDSPREGVA